MSIAQLNDEARQNIFAEVEKLEAALAMIAGLSDASKGICYVTLDREIARRRANASQVARSAAQAEPPRDVEVVATEPSSNAESLTNATAPSTTSTTSTTIETTPSDPISSAPSTIEPTPSDPISSAPSTIEPTPNDPISSAPSTIKSTSNDPISSAASTIESTPPDATSTTSSISPTSSDRPSDDPTSIALTSTGPSDEIPIDPFAEAKERKEREIAALERDYFARILAAAKGNISHAARLAGKDRSNFKRKLEEHGLRPPGTRMTTSKNIGDAGKLTDKIVQHLARNPHGLRTYEIAEHIEQAIGNAHNLLKHLKGQNRIERHGKRYNTLWTLADGTPEPRVETIPQAAVVVVSDAKGPVDGRRLRDEMAARLRDARKSPSKAALRRAIGRLVLSGVLASGGASTNGALYRLGPNAALYMLGPKREESELN